MPAAIAAAARLPAPKARESKQEAAAREHRERAAALRGQLDPPRPGHATSRESERWAEQERERWTSRESDPPWMDQAEREAARRVRMAQDAEREAVQRTDEAMAPRRNRTLTLALALALTLALIPNPNP